MYCTIPLEVPMELTVTSEYVPGQLRMDLNYKNKWQPGSELSWGLIQDPTNSGDIEAIEEGFKQWSEICFIKFKRLNNNDKTALIRIGFDQKNGSWSLIGTDILQKNYNDQQTMNFSFPVEMKEKEKKYVTLHVIGHALGFPHEHQNPNSGIKWNREEVYAEMEKQGWTKNLVDHNILNPHKGIPGFEFDPKSIMNYGFAKNLISEPPEYREGLPAPEGFSKQDIKLAQKFYPLPKPKLEIEQGGMLNVHIKKDETKIIRIQFKSQSSQFHVSSLVAIPNTTVEILLKNGQNIVARGVTNSAPLKGYIDAESNDWSIELKYIPADQNEIPVTVIVF
jgi:predicted DNA-binding protein (UPF0251 family)